MDLHLSGKRVLVTGASKGIGHAVALLLAEEGCDLVLVSRGGAALATAAEAVRARRQVSVQVIAADLSRQAEVERVAAEAGALDVLVNNAGAIPPGDLLAIDDAAWRAAWDLKVFGYIGLARALYPRLKERRGVIVNVIGAAGEYLDPNYIAGSVGNAALMAFTRSLGKAAPKDGMRVVGINPGPVGTGRSEMLLRARARRDLCDEARGRRGALAGISPHDGVRPPGDARRDRQRGGVPGIRAIGLHDRNDPDHRRRSGLSGEA